MGSRIKKKRSNKIPGIEKCPYVILEYGNGMGGKGRSGLIKRLLDKNYDYPKIRGWQRYYTVIFLTEEEAFIEQL